MQRSTGEWFSLSMCVYMWMWMCFECNHCIPPCESCVYFYLPCLCVCDVTASHSVRRKQLEPSVTTCSRVESAKRKDAEEKGDDARASSSSSFCSCCCGPRAPRVCIYICVCVWLRVSFCLSHCVSMAVCAFQVNYRSKWLAWSVGLFVNSWKYELRSMYTGELRGASFSPLDSPVVLSSLTGQLKDGWGHTQYDLSSTNNKARKSLWSSLFSQVPCVTDTRVHWDWTSNRGTFSPSSLVSC